MKKTVKLALSSLLAIVLMSGMALALDRELLYSEKLSGRLQGIASKIQNVRQPEIPYSGLPAETEYFVRIAPRSHILAKNNAVKNDAILGTKPFVFFTIPQGIYDKSLLDVYLDIGYEAEDIIRWQRDKDMVAIVFRYPENIRYSNVKNGQLPEKWDKKVYSTTWDNMFSLFSRLAEKAISVTSFSHFNRLSRVPGDSGVFFTRIAGEYRSIVPRLPTTNTSSSELPHMP